MTLDFSILSLPSAAIIIDVWSGSNELPDKIINFLDKNKLIKLVILSTGESADGLTHDFVTTNQWYSSYYKEVGGSKQTHPKILNYNNPEKLLTIAPDSSTFYSIFKKYSEIRNVYVMGGDYKVCVMKRPLGVIALKNTLLPTVADFHGFDRNEFNILFVPELLSTLIHIKENGIDSYKPCSPNLMADKNLEKIDFTHIFKLTTLEHPYYGYNTVDGVTTMFGPTNYGK